MLSPILLTPPTAIAAAQASASACRSEALPTTTARPSTAVSADRPERSVRRSLSRISTSPAMWASAPRPARSTSAWLPSSRSAPRLVTAARPDSEVSFSAWRTHSEPTCTSAGNGPRSVILPFWQNSLPRVVSAANDDRSRPSSSPPKLNSPADCKPASALMSSSFRLSMNDSSPAITVSASSPPRSASSALKYSASDPRASVPANNARSGNPVLRSSTSWRSSHTTDSPAAEPSCGRSKKDTWIGASSAGSIAATPSSPWRSTIGRVSRRKSPVIRSSPRSPSRSTNVGNGRSPVRRPRAGCCAGPRAIVAPRSR
ncbi:hypothetical protein [Nannocystis pusilla]|uniref:hypothetical protein n=1 Tax=Nannocystis pusilla TaxID=889268 RepID=UPI003B79261B